MYAALWRILPGPIWLRVIFAVALVAAVLFVLATWVYPWVDALLVGDDSVVGGP
jgi:hypothetical protein